MPYCPDCAVEVDDSVEVCPLCGAAVQQELVLPGRGVPRLMDGPVRIVLPWQKLRGRIFAVLTCVLIMPLVIVWLIDMLDGNATWSRYVMIPLACAWLTSALWLYKIRRPVQLLLGQLVVTSGLLLGLDSCYGGVNWFVTLAGPAIVAWSLWTVPMAWLLVKRKVGWANGTAWCLLGITLFCVALDMLISQYRSSAPVPTWSLIVLIGLLPVTVFLLYVHHRVRKHVNLAKWFHV
ncbi:MAG: hypothetical protein K9N55_11110 [Phycisphaerae bacterium]|nr:hypothetical protein [Phycisphaerae bacterium]